MNNSKLVNYTKWSPHCTKPRNSTIRWYIMGYIYMISNNYDTNVYIGQTRRPAETRWKEHIYAATHGGDSYMYRAMNKHGIENFFFEIIENV